MAATACAPPALNTCDTPQRLAAASTAALARPSAAGGVHSTRCGQPTSCAGIATMITVEGRGAEPAGTYRPTAGIGRYNPLAAHTGHHVHRQRRGQLRGMETPHIVDGGFDGRDLLRVELLLRVVELRLGDGRAARAFARSKRSAYASQRRIAVLAHLADDGARQRFDVAGRIQLRACERAAATRGNPEHSSRESALSSGQHLFHRQHQHGAGAGSLQAFKRFPEHVLAAHRMHRHLVRQTLRAE